MDSLDEDRCELDMMDHRQIEDHLPGFALGCLDPQEADLITAHLTTCASCQALLKSYERTVGHLAFGVTPVMPPESLKSELMSRTRSRSSSRISRNVKSTWSIETLFRWISPAWAMAGIVVILSLGTVNVWQWRQTHSIANQLSAPLRIVKMRGTDLAPHADGTFVIGQDNFHGVLVASDLPKIRNDQQFQLWFIKDGEISMGGTFSTTIQGYAVMQVSAPHPHALSDYQTAMVTIEPLGGSPFPSGPRLMVAVF